MFVITGLISVVNMDLGLKNGEKKIVFFNQEFILTKFVITEFDCTIYFYVYSKILERFLLRFSASQVYINDTLMFIKLKIIIISAT